MMYQSYNKSVGVVAMLAAAGIAASTFAASAADLGGNCCADLEERIAELEATTARKGNRKVSLQVFGQISESVVWWNDGAEKNTFVLENQDQKNKLGFQGNAKINSDWSAGFMIELQVRAYRSSSYNQLALGASQNVSITTFNTQSISLRQANWYLDSKTYGRVTVGRVAEAASGAGLVNLASPDGFAGHGYAAGRAHQGLLLRRSGTVGNAGLSSLNWNAAFHRNNSNTADYEYTNDHSGVKYTSPFFMGQSTGGGLQFQASWGQDDIGSVALRYVETFGAFRVAAAIGYSQATGPDMLQCSNLSGTAPGATNSTVDCNLLQTSGSIMHTPTGLYASGGYGQIEDKNRDKLSNQTNAGLSRFIDDKDSSWWIQGGWVAKLNSFGATTFWGQYASYTSHGGIANQGLTTLGAADVLNSFGTTVSTATIQTAKADTWSLGITQDVDAAAMKLYLGYLNSSADLTLINRSNFQTRKSNQIDDVSVFYSGATIKF